MTRATSIRRLWLFSLSLSLFHSIFHRGKFFFSSFLSYYPISLISVDPLWLTEIKDLRGFVKRSRLHSTPTLSLARYSTIFRWRSLDRITSDVGEIALRFRKMLRRRINADKDADLFNPLFTTNGRTFVHKFLSFVVVLPRHRICFKCFNRKNVDA